MTRHWTRQPWYSSFKENLHHGKTSWCNWWRFTCRPCGESGVHKNHVILTDAFWKTIVMKLGRKQRTTAMNSYPLLNYEDKANNVINASGKAMNNCCQAWDCNFWKVSLRVVYLPRPGKWHVISMEFLRSFLRRHLAGKPVIASPNVGCFLRLLLRGPNERWNSGLRFFFKESLQEIRNLLGRKMWRPQVSLGSFLEIPPIANIAGFAMGF